jgi:hypothetical protein
VSTALAGSSVLRSRLRASVAPATGRALELNTKVDGGWNVFVFSAPTLKDKFVPIQVAWAGMLRVRFVKLSTLTTLVPKANPSPETEAPRVTPCVLETFKFVLPPTIETPVSSL